MTRPVFGLAGKRVYVAGHAGMVGAALVRRLQREGCAILTAPRACDLREQALVLDWFAENRPHVVVLAAAKVGGILANQRFPASFLYDNLMIEANVVEAARQHGASKLLLLGSSCIYPKFSPQPISEDALLTGALEPTNQWYAIAKIAGVKLCQAYRGQYGCDFIAAMPTNLYGPGDNFDLENSHVMPALIRKAHDAKVTGAEAITIWGTGTPRREFLYVDDLADACVCLLQNYTGELPVNVGVGADISIADLARLVCREVGFDGAVGTDPEKPDGTPQKLLDNSVLAQMGWRPQMPLRAGIAAAYQWFLANVARRQ
ncbi:GDP-L-fucose synthase [Tsuneonella suprasediminis]|uniref:GDP-L-fucose synthase family protein n=1 Tax=Tsuneonella suprasediminis TaxID=2306996 RepID=UPI002F956A2F